MTRSDGGVIQCKDHRIKMPITAYSPSKTPSEMSDRHILDILIDMDPHDEHQGRDQVKCLLYLAVILLYKALASPTTPLNNLIKVALVIWTSKMSSRMVILLAKVLMSPTTSLSKSPL